MNATRRSILSAAMATPLLAPFTGAAPDAAASTRLGTVSDAWAEVRWTPQTQALLDRYQAEVKPVAPARTVKDTRGRAIRFPVRSGEGDPSLADPRRAHGTGRLDGGITFRTPGVTVQAVDLESVLKDGQATGKYLINGADVGHGPVFRPGLDEGRLTTENVPPGKPMKVRIEEVPLRPTQELLRQFTLAFGSPAFSEDTVLAHAAGEGVYTPPKK
ncbi:hypothetical protein [Streptomyces daliensis]|uniref:Uncharacterized protein n=1 Tax=Streptomyces daliensis TaxID=299421 RepID=A0A8T4IXK2_9ACTN|nr:hypothetical protein [Streptomyces daliensis]